MAALLRTLKCRYHPERPAFATCTRCGARICQECSTPHDGAHTCRPCLERLQAASSGGRVWAGSALQLLLLLACLLALPPLITWTTQLWAGLLP